MSDFRLDLTRLMKKPLLSIFFLLATITSYCTEYVWTGSTKYDWATPTNWSPNGVPGITDDVTISNTTNNPVLDQNRSIDDISYSSGTIDLNGYNLTIDGNANELTSGTISNGHANFTGNSSHFKGTIFNCVVYATSSNIYLNGSTFKDTLIINKTGAGENKCDGGNIFEGYTLIENSGSSYLRMAEITGDSLKGKTY